MVKRNTSIKKTAHPLARKQDQNRIWKNVFLSLTLVPLVGGVLLIIAWLLDWNVIASLESQVWIGVLFLLISFTFSNLIQQRWLLFWGWLLLAVADFIFLIWVNLYAQIAAGLIGIIGVGFLGFRFFQEIAQRAEKR